MFLAYGAVLTGEKYGLGRLGGEDFCVVLVQKGMDGALLLAERLRLVTEAMRVPCDDATIQVTVSIGVTE